jgi:catechol 2,3-dioxygenase-like lactoylglutathione lyase family enzyme
MPRTFKIAAIATLLFSSLGFAQTTPAPKTFITGVGNFIHVVADWDRSWAFYRDAIGLQITENPRFPPPRLLGGMSSRDRSEAWDRLFNTGEADHRHGALSVPGSTIGVELVEFLHVPRTPVHPRFQDPGAANLIIGVRDIDSVLEKIRKIPEAKILSGEAGKTALVQDPDGFMVELVVTDTPGRGNVVGGGIELTIEDTAKTVDFYTRVLGLPVTVGVPGGTIRRGRVPIPGTTAAIGFVEFSQVDRKPMKTRTQDPGTAMLQLYVRDLNGLMKVLKSNGAEIISSGGEPVFLGDSTRVIVRDPNNLFLELIQP